MTIEKNLRERSESKCELCAATDNLSAYEVSGSKNSGTDAHALLCETCKTQIEDRSTVDVNHWRCLTDSMWSQVPAVQALVFRMLTQFNSESWAQDALDMIYLEDETRQWAEAGISEEGDEVIQRDSNGAVLAAGDTVTLIKDLVVKGANFTAKRGTAVRNISLTDNPDHIEGRVEGTRIVILTCFVKKSN